MNRDHEYKLLTSVARIAKCMNLDRSTIRKAYVQKIDTKFNHLRSIDLGTWIIENEVTNGEIVLAINTIRATKEQIIKGVGNSI